MIDDQVNGWIQIDLLETMDVTGVITQGRGPGDNRDEWVESFTIEYGNDMSILRTLTDEKGKIKVSAILK